jgi:Flp pilus assembly protein TadD
MTLALSRGRVPRWLTEEAVDVRRSLLQPRAGAAPMHRELFDAWKGDDLLPDHHVRRGVRNLAHRLRLFPRRPFVRRPTSNASACRRWWNSSGTLADRRAAGCRDRACSSANRPPISTAIFAARIGRMVGGWKLHPDSFAGPRGASRRRRGRRDARTVASLVELGNFALASGNPTEAEARLVAARALDAEAPTVRWLRRASRVRSSGRNDRALDLMNGLVEAGFEDFDLFLALGEKAGKRRSGCPERSIRYTRAIAALPEGGRRSARRVCARRGRSAGRTPGRRAGVARRWPRRSRPKTWNRGPPRSSSFARRATRRGCAAISRTGSGSTRPAPSGISNLRAACEGRRRTAVGRRGRRLRVRRSRARPRADRRLRVRGGVSGRRPGDPKTALLRLDKALSETPDDAPARALRARIDRSEDPPR